jgi:hypothetical protein
VAGVGLSVQTAGTVRATRLRVESKRRDLDRLRAIEAEVKRAEAAKRAAEQRPARLAESLLPLVQAQFAAFKAEDFRETRRDLVPGWAVRQTEVSFGEVPFAGVMEFVRKAEAMNPPWRLAQCTLRASPVAPGAGQVVLQFEAVQKKE